MKTNSLLLLALVTAMAFPACQCQDGPPRYHGHTGFRGNFLPAPTCEHYSAPSNRDGKFLHPKSAPQPAPQAPVSGAPQP